MVRQKVAAKINPDVLKWIIDSSGWSNREIAKKLEVSPKTILQWRSKKQAIDIHVLEKLAECAKRPLAVFFLPRPPSEPPLTDFRRLASNKPAKLSRETILAIRVARYQQSVAYDLLKQQRLSTTPRIKSVIKISDDPEAVAVQERKRLGFDSEDGLLAPDARGHIGKRYSKLRAVLESLNIFVFQASFPVDEVRGLTLSDALPRAIVINSADAYPARIFSLMHEYGHILLNEGGICVPKYGQTSMSASNQERIESWCNKFAAAVLVPADTFLDSFHKLDGKQGKPESIVDALSRQFRVSKQVIIVRIIKSFPKHPDLHYYAGELKLLQVPSSQTRGGGFARPVDLCLSRRGKKYISLVLDSREKEIINTSDTIDYLDLKLKHFDAVQERL